MYEPIPYHITVVAVYACILLICILALYYGFRARRNVKREKITALPRGFSPLDIQRIFIGKTYPRKLTRALIVHWAQLGFVRVKYVSKYRVTLTCRRPMPTHSDDKAVFFDRGTYVRERDLFNKIFKNQGSQITVNINKPLISRSDAKYISSEAYAAREDEGVYSTKHYKLKVFTYILSFLPFTACGIYMCAAGAMQGVILPFMIIIGTFVFRFILEIPFWFRLIWSSAWTITPAVLMIVYFSDAFDPFLLGWVSVATLFIGSFFLIRFVDFREKQNLSDYSDLVNFKKFLLFSGRTRLGSVDYYEVLPYLYAFNIKFLVKRKFMREVLPEWFVSEDGKRGSLL